jgi:acetoacetyl-CoA synthase
VTTSVSIVGTGSVLPPRTVSSAAIAARVREVGGIPMAPSMIEVMTGIRERRHVDDGVLPSVLAAEAGERALEDAGLTGADVDLLIFCANSRDVGEPATANVVQMLVGCPRASVFDVANGCNSFLSALEISRALLESTPSRTALVVSAEVLSLGIDYAIQDTRELRNKFAALTLGDGAGAVVLQRSATGRTLLPATFLSAGEHWQLSGVAAGGANHIRQHAAGLETDYYFRCESSELQRVSTELLPGIVDEALDAVGWSASEVDHVIPHQLSKAVATFIAHDLKMTNATCHLALDVVGNVGAASIPLTLDRCARAGELEPGQKVLLIGIASGWSGGVCPLIW